MKVRIFLFLNILVTSMSIFASEHQEIGFAFFQNNFNQKLSFEILDDQTLHFVYSVEKGAESPLAIGSPLFVTSSYIKRREDGKSYDADFPGPSSRTFKVSDSDIVTND